MKGKDIILGLLKTKGPLTGYEINEILQKQLDYFCEGSYGMIYPTLRKLEKAGLVKKEKVSQEDKPNKNVFSILDLGKEEFNKSFHAPLQDEEFNSDFLTKIYFGDQFTREDSIKIIEDELEIKKKKLSVLKENFTKWKNGIDSNQQVTYDYGILYYNTIIKFLEEKLAQFKDSDQ